MLAVQVNYWQLIETKRHNLVSEKQNATALKLQERDVTTREKAQVETARHNEVTEAQGWASISETSRHNMAIEALTGEQNKIAWYNAETNRLNYQINRSNLDVNWFNAYTNRQNVANQYSLGLMNVAIAQQNANSNTSNAATNRTNAQTRQSEVQNNYTIGMGNLGVAQRNAATNETNASTNQWNAATNAQRAQNDFWYQQESVRQKDTENVIKGIGTAIEGFRVLDQSNLLGLGKNKKDKKSKYIKGALIGG